MKNKSLSFYPKIVTLLFLFFTGATNSLFSQGWSLTIYISAAAQDAIDRNDIMEIPPYKNGRTFPIGLYPKINTQVIQFHHIDEDYAGAASGHNPDGSSSLNSHIPVSGLMGDGDEVIVLTNKVDGITGAKDLFLSSYITDNSNTNTPNTLNWHEPVFADMTIDAIGANLKNTLDGNYIVLGSIASEITVSENLHELILTKLDANGLQLWSKTYNSSGNDIGVSVIPAPAGGFWLLKNVQMDSSSPTTIWLMKTDENGELEWETNLSTSTGDTANDMVLTESGELVITGNNENQDLFVLKTNAAGEQIWRQDYDFPMQNMIGKGIIEDYENDLVVVGQRIMEDDGKIDPFAAKISTNGTPIWEKFYPRENINRGFNDIALAPSGQYLMGGFSQLSEGSDSYGARFAKSDTFGIIKGGLIQGNVFHDFDLDCTMNNDEIGLEDWVVQAVNDTLSFYTNTDENGNYFLPVDTKSGAPIDYTVSAFPISSYWDFCENDIPVAASYLDTIAIDFAAQALINCPFPELQLNNTAIRPCESSDIQVQYCNTGTAVAENAGMEITLHDFLTFENSTITPTTNNGQTYTFDFGEVPINECVSFVITAMVDCDAEIGDVLCMDAQIFPDTICMVPGQAWSGALLQANYTCNNDEIQFNIENIGSANMNEALDYIIIEDAVLLMQGNVDLAPTQNIQPDALPLDGSIYHLILPQESGAPGAPWITLNANDCPNGTNSEFNQLPNYQGNPFMLTFCLPTVGPYDPNDKQAYPVGVGENHDILPNTNLEYKIRFQNVGTDTAFRVVIRDTLSQFVNPASIVPGLSSHPYDWRLDGDGHLTFTFQNINLPDSTTNLAASQGFITYKIAQREDLAEGTRIENRAGIYFDFNDPIITNTTFHTIKYWLDIIDETVTVAQPTMEVKIMPNPMTNGAWIELKGSEYDEMLELTLFDVTGKKIKTVQGTDGKIWLKRDGLNAGMYFFTIENDGIWQASGKVLID